MSSTLVNSIATTIAKKFFHVPFNDTNTKTVMGIMGRAKLEKAAVSTTYTGTLMTGGIATHAGKLNKIYVAVGKACGGTETVTIDVLKNGSSILTTTWVMGATSLVNTVQDISSLITAGTQISVGDLITTTGTYSAGSGSANPTYSTVVEWG